MTSYYGNSKAQIVANSDFITRFETVEATALSDKAYLSGLISSEASTRLAEDAVLNNRISSEKNFVLDRIDEQRVLRENADTLLRNDLNSEISTRAGLTTALRTDLTATQADLASEISTRAELTTALRTDLTSEASTRLAEDTVLNNRISSEKNFILDRLDEQRVLRENADTAILSDLSAEAVSRLAGDNTLNERIDTEKAFLLNAVNTAVANLTLADQKEATARANADALLRTDLNTVSAQAQSHYTQAQSRYISTNSRLDALESGLQSQVEAMIANNALDVVQTNLINQAVVSLGQSDSVIYTKIAEKASLLVNNDFKLKFNSYLTDFFENYSIKTGPSGARVEKNATDYQVLPEVAHNDDPALSIPASYTPLMASALVSDSAPSPYVAYASSIIGIEYQAYKAFNKVFGKAEDNFGWHSGVNSYPAELDYGAGYFTAMTIVSDAEVKGEWIELGNTASAFDNVKEVVLYGSATLTNQRFPRRVMVAGSNDRTTWTKLMDSHELLGEDINYTEDSTHIKNTQRLLINNAGTYKYLRLIIRKLRAQDYPCLIEVEYKK